MKKQVLLVSAVAVLCAVAGAYIGQQRMTPDAKPATLTALATPATTIEALFAQTLPDAEGKPQPLMQWKQKTLVINFWATWCKPCVQEMPELSALQKEVAAENIQIIGIGIDSVSNIAKFASQYRISYPLYVAGVSGTELSRQFGNQAGALPFTVIADRNGWIKKTYLGRLNIDELRRELAGS